MRTRSKLSASALIAGMAIATITLTTAPAAPAQAVNSTFFVLNDTSQTLELTYKMQPSEPGFEYRTPKVTPWAPTYLGPHQSHSFDPWYMYFAWNRDAYVDYRIAATGETVSIIMTPQFNNNTTRPVATCNVTRDGGQPAINTCSVTGGSGSATSTINITARSADYTIRNLTGTTIDPWPKDINGNRVAIPSNVHQIQNDASFTLTARTDTPTTTYNWMVGITPTKFFTSVGPTEDTASCTTKSTRDVPRYVCFQPDPQHPNKFEVVDLPNFGCVWPRTDFGLLFMSLPPAMMTEIEAGILEIEAKTSIRISTIDMTGKSEYLPRPGVQYIPVWYQPRGEGIPWDWGNFGFTGFPPEGKCAAGTYILLNSATPYPYDTEMVFKHEFLHVLGLNHQDGLDPTLMRSYGLATPSGLKPYDVAAVNALYPVQVH